MTDEVYEFLNRARWTKARIRNRQEQKNDLLLMMLPAGIRYDKDTVQTSPKDQMVEYACKIDEIDREIEELQRRYLTEQQETVAAIEELDDASEQYVLIARYISGERFEDIAEKSFVSESSVYRSHRRGVAHMVDIVDKYVNNQQVDSE